MSAGLFVTLFWGMKIAAFVLVVSISRQFRSFQLFYETNTLFAVATVLSEVLPVKNRLVPLACAMSRASVAISNMSLM